MKNQKGEDDGRKRRSKMIMHTLVSNSCFYEDMSASDRQVPLNVTKNKARFELSGGKITAIFSTNPKDFLKFKVGDDYKG